MKKKKRKSRRKKLKTEEDGISDQETRPKMSQDERMKLSEEILTRARVAAMTSSQRYDREVWKDALMEAMKNATGYEPYSWQVVIGEALKLGLDVLLLAGTGSGKTNTFLFPILEALLRKVKRMIWIFSPLKALQKEQASSQNYL